MKTKILFFGAFLLILISCKKYAGEGGSAIIRGKIMENKYSSGGVLLATYEKAEHDVYIVYGTDDNIFDDKTETSYDGTFSFEYLNKGDYRIFTYEKCNSCPSGDTVVIKEVQIESRKEDIDLGIINVRD